MTNQEKSELPVCAKRKLLFFERGMDEAIHKENFPLAWNYYNMYYGAVFVLKEMGFLSYDEAHDHADTLFNRCLAAQYPEQYTRREHNHES